MNYTAKYHLPQWEETDRIMRTDFNQMCADMEAGLNACYSPDKRPNEYIRMSVTFPGENEVLYTFEQEPILVVMYGYYKTLVLHQNGGGFIGHHTDQYHYSIHLQLKGKELIAVSKDEKFMNFGCDVLALY